MNKGSRVSRSHLLSSLVRLQKKKKKLYTLQVMDRFIAHTYTSIHSSTSWLLSAKIVMIRFSLVLLLRARGFFITAAAAAVA
jgi:hypothetical protein